jgi:hypothetical protein
MPSTVRRCDRQRRLPSFGAIAGIAGVLAAGLIRDNLQAHLAPARVGEQPPSSTPTPLPVRTKRGRVARSPARRDSAAARLYEGRPLVKPSVRFLTPRVSKGSGAGSSRAQTPLVLRCEGGSSPRASGLSSPGFATFRPHGSDEPPGSAPVAYRLLLMLRRRGPGSADPSGRDLARGNRIPLGVNLGLDGQSCASAEARVGGDAQAGVKRQLCLADGRRVHVGDQPSTDARDPGGCSFACESG